MILDYEIGAMQPDERNMVMKDWMRNNHAHYRARIESVVDDDGVVLVARSKNGVALGWIAHVGDMACFGYVKSSYRALGVMRALWERAGRPSKLMSLSTTTTRKMMASLTGREKEG